MLLLVLVWVFSLPPDIRRASTCSSLAELDAFFARFGGCVQASELWDRVVEHYRTCGAAGGAPCFRLDISVDPKSATLFREALDTARGGRDVLDSF